MNSRRELAVFAALILSVLVHTGLVFFVRYRTMAEVAKVERHLTDRRPMTVRDAKKLPDAVSLESVHDLQPLKESPEAASEALMPSASALDEAEENGLTPPVPTEPLKDVPPQPEVKVLPKLSETLKAEDVQSYVTPVADRDSPGLTPPAPRELPSEPAAVAEAEFAPTLPVFDPPPAVKSPAPADPEVPEDEDREKAPDIEFVPRQEVMSEIDETVVASEKAAVRELLDVKDAKELKEYVRLGTHSAQAGEWLYFRVTVDPTAELPVVPKDIVILMDASGSIANDRLRSCRAAAKEILRTCTNTGDRFNLVAFRNDFDYAFRTWQECDSGSFAKADDWMGRLTAHGRTDVFATIKSVLKLPRDPRRPLIAMVVTDGDANAGVSRTADILSKFTELNDGLVSVYMYGVKSTANRELIDVLTHGNRGEGFIFEGSRKEAGSGIEGLSNRFRDPVLTDIRLVFTAASRAEAYPRRLKNLYAGEKVEIVGRVPRGVREVAFSLKGLNGPRAYEGFFRITLSAAEFDNALPGVWAKEHEIDVKLR